MKMFSKLKLKKKNFSEMLRDTISVQVYNVKYTGKFNKFRITFYEYEGKFQFTSPSPSNEW